MGQDIIPTTCSFCGTGRPDAKYVFGGIAIDATGGQHSACICDSCLGLQMTVLAKRDRPHFDKLVEDARAFELERGNPETSN
jgi:hypothetical protein